MYFFFFNLEHLPGIFHHQKIVFHAFISIMVIMPYLHFHFFWRARQWTSHIPSSSALSEQGLNKKQHTTLVVTAACVSNSFFFVCFWKLLYAFMIWQSLQESISHVSQQSDTSMWTQRDREKHAISFVSFSTEERFDSFCQPLSLKSSHRSAFLACTEVWQEHRMADDLPYIASLIFHRQIVFQFGTVVCPRVSRSVFTQW